MNPIDENLKHLKIFGDNKRRQKDKQKNQYKTNPIGDWNPPFSGEWQGSAMGKCAHDRDGFLGLQKGVPMITSLDTFFILH